MRNSHGLRRQFDQAIRIERARIGRCRRIEHRPGDQGLEEVAVDIEVLEDDLLEEGLEVESRWSCITQCAWPSVSGEGATSLPGTEERL